MAAWDVAIVGGGILGTSVAYWLANRYEGRIAVLEAEGEVAEHASRRNTGVLHRPFYLDPRTRAVFARSSQASYGMWKRYAAERGLPWSPVGTFEVALAEAQVPRLEKYYEWGQENGMAPEELAILTPEEVRRSEPHVRCAGAIWSKTDTGVDYRAFTLSLRHDAERAGAAFLMGREVLRIRPKGDLLEIGVRRHLALPRWLPLDPRGRIGVRESREETILARYLINCAGARSMDIAHLLGVGRRYTDLHFRGEYWTVRTEHHYLASRNIYSVPRHPELPFLDPHWIVRVDGRREIGPNAVPVTGPTTYRGFFEDPADVVRKFFEPPVANKVTLLTNPDFMTLATEEWLSSISKRAMARRVQQFLPDLRVSHLLAPGTAGVRASVIDRDGSFIKEAIELEGPHSFHVLNYNSPGATGSPAYAAWLLGNLATKGFLDHLRARAAPPPGPWDFDTVRAAVASRAV